MSKIKIEKRDSRGETNQSSLPSSKISREEMTRILCVCVVGDGGRLGLPHSF
jgi:hypothetical protein